VLLPSLAACSLRRDPACGTHPALARITKGRCVLLLPAYARSSWQACRLVQTGLASVVAAPVHTGWLVMVVEALACVRGPSTVPCSTCAAGWCCGSLLPMACSYRAGAGRGISVAGVETTLCRHLVALAGVLTLAVASADAVFEARVCVCRLDRLLGALGAVVAYCCCCCRLAPAVGWRLALEQGCTNLPMLLACVVFSGAHSLISFEVSMLTIHLRDVHMHSVEWI
jgi:hypothetical protein